MTPKGIKEIVPAFFWMFVLPVIFMIAIGHGFLGIPYESRVFAVFIFFSLYAYFILAPSPTGQEKSEREIRQDFFIIGAAFLLVVFGMAY